MPPTPTYVLKSEFDLAVARLRALIRQGGGGGSTAWADITGKPSWIDSFNPDAYQLLIEDVSDPTASGTAIAFIDSISQSNGKIQATKKTVRNATASQSGVVSTGAQTFGGLKTFAGDLVVASYIQVGSVKIVYDADNGGLKIEGNLYATGNVSAGGIGSGGSGGSTHLRLLEDVKHNATSILRLDGSAIVNGDILAYDTATGLWYAKAETGGGGGGVSDYDQLDNRPKIDNHTLVGGNQTPASLGLQALNTNLTDISGLTPTQGYLYFDGSDWMFTSPTGQVQADWNVTDQTSPAYIKNKPAAVTESTVAGWGFGKVKTISLNGTSYSPNTSGVVNLGTDWATQSWVSGSFATSASLSTLSSIVSTQGSSISALHSDVTGLSGDISSVSSALQTLQGTVTSQGASISTLQTTVSGHTTSIGTLQTTVSGLSTTVAGHTSTLSSLSTNVNNLSSTVSDLATDLNDLAYELHNDYVTLDTPQTITGKKIADFNPRLKFGRTLEWGDSDATAVSLISAGSDNTFQLGAITHNLYFDSADMYFRSRSNGQLVNGLYIDSAVVQCYHNFVPQASSANLNLGTPAKEWQNIYLSGKIYLGAVTGTLAQDMYITRGGGSDSAQLYIHALGATYYEGTSLLPGTGLDTTTRITNMILGNGSFLWKEVWASKWMADKDGHYIDYDANNQAFHVHGNIYADGYVSAGGMGQGGSGSSVGNLGAIIYIEGAYSLYIAVPTGTSLAGYTLQVGRHRTQRQCLYHRSEADKEPSSSGWKQLNTFPYNITATFSSSVSKTANGNDMYRVDMSGTKAKWRDGAGVLHNATTMSGIQNVLAVFITPDGSSVMHGRNSVKRAKWGLRLIKDGKPVTEWLSFHLIANIDGAGGWAISK